VLASEHARRLEDQISSGTPVESDDPQDWETAKILVEGLLATRNQYALSGYLKSVRHYLKWIKQGDFHTKIEIVNMLITADKWYVHQHAMPY